MSRQKDHTIDAGISSEDYILEDEFAEQAALLGEGTLYAVKPGVGSFLLDDFTYLVDPTWNAPYTASVYDRVLNLL